MKKLKILIITALLLHLGMNLKAQNINYGLLAGYAGADAHLIKRNEYALLDKRVVDGENHFLGTFELQLNYVQLLPIIANLYCTDRFYISFGPEFAYLMTTITY